MWYKNNEKKCSKFRDFGILHRKDHHVRVYMDVCCLNRPFDDLSQDRINLEAEAVLTILSQCAKGKWTLVKSSIIDYELSQIQNRERYEQVKILYNVAAERIATTSAAEERAIYFQKHGLKPLDSLHLAVAEENGVVFLSTDDKLLRAAKRLDLTIQVENPVSWLEVI